MCSVVAGVDGCKAGWFAVVVDYNGKLANERYRVCPEFADVLALEPKPDVIAVDIPIGLLAENERGGRDCDIEARRQLRQPRGTSVFSPPIRPTLLATDYDEAKVLNGGLSRQAYGILPKILEVDQKMTPDLQRTVHEVHPELSFLALAGKPMAHSKKKKPGQVERLELLKKAGFTRIDEALDSFPRKSVAVDDVLDAYVAAWTATRIATKQATIIPTESQTDSKGLRMEMSY